MPLNRDTEKLYYNHRIILDNKVLTEPRVWKISKVNRTSSNGICVYTCAQDHFDQHKDYIEKDSNGNVIGMWADYYSSAVTPSEPDPLPTAIIKCSGLKPQFKVGGSYKKLTVKFENDIEVEGEWRFEHDGEPATNLVTLAQQNPSEIKVKFVGGDDYIGEVFTAKYMVKGRSIAQIELEVVSL